jgi:hypothetical protein
MINVVGAADPLAPSPHPEVVPVPIATPVPTTEPVQTAHLPETPVSASGLPPKKAPDHKKMQLIVGGIFLLLLVVGGGIALVLSKTNQDLRQQASGGQTYTCSAGTGVCTQLGFDYCNLTTHTCAYNPTPPPPTLPPRIAQPTATPPPRSSQPTNTPVPTVPPTRTPTRIPTRTPTLPLNGSPVPTDPAPTDPAPTDPPPTLPITRLGAVLNPTAEPTDPPNGQAATDPTNTPTLAANTNLAAGLSPTPTLVKTTASCNESCTTSENCQNPSHICSEGVCRLESNPTDTNCRLPSGGTQIALDPTQASRVYTPEAAPSGTALVSGPADWLLFLQVGAGFLSLGTLALLFL